MPTKWEKFSTFAQCIQAAVVAVTLILIVYQLDQQAHQLEQQAALARAANVHSLAGMMIPLNMKLTETEMADLWENGPIGGSTGDENLALREAKYKALLASYLIFYENVYSQYKAGLLPENIYNGWNTDLESVIDGQPIEYYWQDWREGYHGDFRNHVDGLVNAKPTPSPSTSASPATSPAPSASPPASSRAPSPKSSRAPSR